MLQDDQIVEMRADVVTTRQQLQGYGASRYLARTVTTSLTPVGKEGRANTYSINDVVASIRSYLQNSRIKSTTQEALNIILKLLLERLGNVVKVSFGPRADPELSELTKQLFKAISQTDRALGELKATAASIKKRK